MTPTPCRSTTSIEDLAKAYTIRVQELIGAIPLESIVEAALAVRHICRSGGTVFVCGNGGSASTASHMACDLSKNVTAAETGRLRVISLTDNMAHFSAIANDLDYASVFVEPLRNLMTGRDALIAVSASGNSPNVVQAARFARDLGVPVIGLTGFSGGTLRELATHRLHVECDQYGPVEDLHLIINHLLVTVLTALLAEGRASPP